MHRTSGTLLVLCALVAPLASAQNLSLFEPVETTGEGQVERSAEIGLVTQPAAGNGAPAFTLRSSSRFGDEYRSVLVDQSGGIVEVLWHAGEQVEVPGHFGHAVIAVNSKELSILHSGSECVAADTAGVRCLDANTSVLTLATLSPLTSNGTSDPAEQALPGNAEGEAVIMGPDGEQTFVNPFTGVAEAAPQLSETDMAAREQRARARAERLEQFQVERLSEADVPPGMRLVRTPFGDRLVPVRE